ncbi:MAG: EAL domain-containing protein [Eubacteriales bacterium]|nr:EAL domain-containing protein [Eubacteriales bacterium]
METEKKIMLVADDAESSRSLMRAIFEDEYRVIEAKNGVEALEALYSVPNIEILILDISMPELDGFGVMAVMHEDVALRDIPTVVVTASEDLDTQIGALEGGAVDVLTKPINPQIVIHRIKNIMARREADKIAEQNRAIERELRSMDMDEKSGIYNKYGFFRHTARLLRENPEKRYVITRWDMDDFKVFNDIFGAETGDAYIRHVGDSYKAQALQIPGLAVYARYDADHFICCREAADFDPDKALTNIEHTFAEQAEANFKFVPRMGIYKVENPALDVALMCDRALLALRSTKGRFDTRYAWYDDSMRAQMLEKQEITTEMQFALQTGQFVPFLQPQYNHSTGAMIGAEALARWNHPQKGLLSPAAFIQLFESNGFIYELDKSIWEQVCMLIRKWLDMGKVPLPLSVNVSRYDIFQEGFYETITGFVEKYRVPIYLMRLEITESAFAKSTAQIIDVVERLCAYGFLIEIDDFGCGYSSFNTLKAVPAHILKLDMRFLEGDDNSQRGGNILQSIVRMAKWLGMPIIAEGVESREQADFLRSIGCHYVQGYFYARPMSVAEYEVLEAGSGKEAEMIALSTVETLNNNAFWDPKSMDTLIFNSYVGGACIFEYQSGKVDILRVNQKFAQMLGGAEMTIEDALGLVWMEHMDEKNARIMLDCIEQAIETGEETSCEVMIRNMRGKPGFAHLHCSLRVIARNDEQQLFYCTVENMTAQWQAETKLRETAEQLQIIMDNVNGGVTAIYLRDNTPQFLFANDRYCQILGYTKEQFFTEVHAVHDLILSEDRPLVVEQTAQASAKREPRTCVYRAKRRDGGIVWLESNISVTTFPDINDPVQLTVTNDITAQRKALEAADETAAQLRLLNEIAGEMLSQGDPDEIANSMLEKLRAYFDGSRAYVFELDWQARTGTNTYESCASGEAEKRREVSFAVLRPWIDAFEETKRIYIKEGEAEEENAAKQSLLRFRNAHAIMAVAMRREGRMIGFLGIDDPQREHAQPACLETLGDYMAVVLTRRDIKYAN